jgi:transcriptional regulator with XRE-family HTH domain
MSKQPIAQIRRNKGLTLDAVAALFGVDRTTVIRWEKGAPMIPLKRLDKAVEVYGVSKRKIRPDIFEAAR